MEEDRLGLALSTGSAAAAAAFREGNDLLVTHWPGAAAAFDRAIAADPGFAMAHAARAHAALRAGDAAAVPRHLAAAEALAAGTTERERRHIGYFGLLLRGQGAAALAALPDHMRDFPRDALVLDTAITPNGLIGSSGRADRHDYLIGLMEGLAPYYGNDWWFGAMHGMALSEAGRPAAGRPKVEAALAARPEHAWGAHALAHICYESGEVAAGIGFLRAWLPGYAREGTLYSHLAWHQALGELAAGDTEAAWATYLAGCGPASHTGPVRLKLTDGVSFLLRWELAGQARPAEAWGGMLGFARAMFPRPGFAFADLHVALAEAMAGDGAALERWVAEVRALEAAGRYPSGPVLPACAAGFAAFARGDYAGAVEALAPVAAERDRIGGSRAQMDLVEFTLLRACLLAGQPERAARRRPGPGAGPVAGAPPP
ncbi:tetratricopeptide repeat protein [Siccirubricoccus phaeus]|uniref:tetratricopeptide repeat protein n=1 Tax=Siccirubricoccus phaeus TaxID=2595053 RepID=UPI0011F191FC|nr:tetratricopeptide repeat protein [Siccirubricoccus phaeus]